MELLTDKLTDKERVILTMLGKGYDAQDIAGCYNVTVDSFYIWMRAIRHKLGAKTDIEAFGRALTAGDIE